MNLNRKLGASTLQNMRQEVSAQSPTSFEIHEHPAPQPDVCVSEMVKRHTTQQRDSESEESIGLYRIQTANMTKGNGETISTINRMPAYGH